MTVSQETVKRRMLSNPDVRQHHEAQAPEYALAREFIAARTRAGLSQAELAQRMDTTQSVIARLESGRVLPSMRTLRRLADAVGATLTVRLETKRTA